MPPKRRIPLVVAFTQDYLLPASVMLLSVLLSSPDEATYEVVCLPNTPLSEKDLSTLRQVDGGSGRLQFRFLELGNKLDGVYVDSKYTAAANYRLIIADLLPDYDKAIYLDCDIIVRNDLSRLYNKINLSDKYIGAVAEASTDWQIKRMPKGCTPGEYINSGFLVMNLELMRQDNISAKLIEALKVPYLEFPDQDALNIVMAGKILYLPPYYNGIRSFFLPAYKSIFLRYYSKEDWNKVAQYGTIHYTGEKPWRAYTNLFEEWWRMYWKLPDKLRGKYPINRKVEFMAKCFTLPFVRQFTNGILQIKRRLKR